MEQMEEQQRLQPAVRVIQGSATNGGATETQGSEPIGRPRFRTNGGATERHVVSRDKDHITTKEIQHTFFEWTRYQILIINAYHFVDEQNLYLVQVHAKFAQSTPSTQSQSIVKSRQLRSIHSKYTKSIDKCQVHANFAQSTPSTPRQSIKSTKSTLGSTSSRIQVRKLAELAEEE